MGDLTLTRDHSVEIMGQHFTVVPFVFQFYPVCNFGKFINFGLGTVRRERVNQGLSHFLV